MPRFCSRSLLPPRWLDVQSRPRAPKTAAPVERPAKAVDTEPVRREAVNRTVNVSGTLAAENEVTVSSQAEGVVSRILADLGDRVAAGQVLVELDREKLQYNLDQQKAALARSLARYGASEPGQPAAHRPDAGRQARGGRAEPGQARLRPRQRAQQAPARVADRRSTTPTRCCAPSRRSTTRRCRTRRTWPPTSTPSNAAAKLAERQLRDASIRAPFDGYVQQRMVSLGELVKAQMPVMKIVRVDPLKVIAEIPEGLAPVGAERPAGGPAGGRVSGPVVHRQGVAHQPDREPADARVSRSRRWCPTRRAC